MTMTMTMTADAGVAVTAERAGGVATTDRAPWCEAILPT